MTPKLIPKHENHIDVLEVDLFILIEKALNHLDVTKEEVEKEVNNFYIKVCNQYKKERRKWQNMVKENKPYEEISEQKEFANDILAMSQKIINKQNMGILPNTL